MAHINTNKIDELLNLCFLLNGRKKDKANEGYDCGFFPKKISTRAHGQAGQPGIEIDFNGIDFGYSWVCVTFNNKPIYIDRDGLDKFMTDDSVKNAKSIFGKNASASIIITEAKWALSEILTEYRDQINQALAG